MCVLSLDIPLNMRREEFPYSAGGVHAGHAITAQHLGLIKRGICGGQRLMLSEYGGVDHR